MEDLVIVDSKDYAQVIFDCTSENFADNEPILCKFTLSGLFEAKQSDFIGIYKVGFTDFQDFLAKKSLNKDLNTAGEVIFELEDLGNLSIGDYYQFVYVSDDKLIRGASIPFTFKKNENKINLIDESYEITSEKSIETPINETPSEKTSINSSLVQSSDDVFNKEDIVKKPSEEWLIKFEEISETNHILYNMLQKHIKEADSLKGQLDDSKKELNEAKELLKRSDDLVHEQKETIEELLNERIVLKDQLEIARQDKAHLISLEQTKEMLKVHVSILKSEKASIEKESLKIKEENLKANEKWLIEREEMKGALYALQIAYVNLEKRFKSIDIKDNDESKRIVNSSVEDYECCDACLTKIPIVDLLNHTNDSVMDACPVCEKQFCANFSREDIADHIDIHFN